VSDLQPHYAAYMRAHGLTELPAKHTGYINWIHGMWTAFRLESAAKYGSEAERQDFEEWLNRVTERVP